MGYALGRADVLEHRWRAHRRARWVGAGAVLAVTLGSIPAVAARAAQTTSRGTGRTASTPISMTVEATETTADRSLALTSVPGRTWSASAPAGLPAVQVDDAVRYQMIKGVGGAMTDSAACLIERHLSARRRAGLMRALFGAGGISLSFIRVPIGASDFTCRRRPYSYDMARGHRDPRLRHFSIRHDEAYVIPAMRSALALARQAFVLASLWSPPGWMKANGRMNNLGGAGWLRQADYRPLANYFVKFIQAYGLDGVPIDAITPQNEPGVDTAYPGLELTEPEEERFVDADLAPALARAGISAGIYGYDFNWDPTPLTFAQQLLSGPARGDLSGVATHCYFGSPTSIATLHDQAPDLDEIVSECSPGIATLTTSELEIASMRNWASAVGLWNLALDPAGQPVQPPNDACRHCTGVVTIDERTRTWTPTLDYYQLGQLSKFVATGAVRIDSPSFVQYAYTNPVTNNVTAGLDDVAFQNPDGSNVLLAYDTSTVPITFAVGSTHGRWFTYTLPPAATVTFTWDGRA